MNNLELIKTLTLDEKARLCSGADHWHTLELKDKGVPSIMLSDGPHGLRKQDKEQSHLGEGGSVPATCFPTAVSLGASFDEELIKSVGVALGKEALMQNVSVVLGPGVNIKRNPLCGRNFEYFSEDPYLSGRAAVAFIRGIQSVGVSACVKHFAANNQEWRRMSVDSIIDERTLREIYLPAFEMAVSDGCVKALMSSYNRLNGEYTNENTHLMRDILRNEWGYNGIVMTDWGGCNDRVKGLEAGNEFQMPADDGNGAEEIIKAVKNGTLDEAVLNECVDRLLNLIFLCDKVIKDKPSELNIKANHNIAKKAAEGSMVLLKNDGVLPLKASEKVAIIGDFAFMPRYQGAGSSIVNPTKLDNTIDLLPSCGLNIIASVRGFDRYGNKNKKLTEEAINATSGADTILLYLGLDEITEAEGLDRTNIKLPQNQLDLLKELRKMGKKIAVVLSAGSAVDTSFDSDVDALLYAGLSGQAGAGAILDILTGKANPSGKLTETYCFDYDDYPSAPYFPGLEQTAEYREGLYVGYRYFDKAQKKVKYPFGFGLSYTHFEYSELKVGKSGASFMLKNSGQIAGAEVAQLYVGLKNSLVPRPLKELKGFKKVYLEAGQEQKIEILFDERTFRYYDTESNSWQIEAGNYDIYIGASSADIRLVGTLSLDGYTPKNRSEKLPHYYSGDIKNVSDLEFEELLGRKIPSPKTIFIKRNRLEVGLNTTISELRYAKGFLGRLVAFVARRSIKKAKKSRDPNAGMYAYGFYNLPVRNMSAMSEGRITRAELNCLLIAFNGKFFKGIRAFLKERKKRKNK